jgi:2-methylcitrate dehydratase PrpD
LESRHGGFLAAFSDGYDSDRIVHDIDSMDDLLDSHIKPYPAAQSTHEPIDQVLDLLNEHRFSPQDIEGVEVGLHSIAALFQRGLAFDNLAQALFSIRYCVALALSEGKVGVDEMTERHLADPAIRALAERVRTVSDAELEAFGDRARCGARVTIFLRDGRKLGGVAHPLPRGARERPFEADVIKAKFDDLAERVVGEAKASEIKDRVLSLDDQADVRDLVRCLMPVNSC